MYAILVFVAYAALLIQPSLTLMVGNYLYIGKGNNKKEKQVNKYTYAIIAHSVFAWGGL